MSFKDDWLKALTDPYFWLALLIIAAIIVVAEIAR